MIMKLQKFCVLASREMIIFCWLFSSICGNSPRNSRALVYPPFTVLQFAAGLAVPAQVPNRTIFTNLGTLHNIPLPSKVNQLYPYARGKARYLTHSQIFQFFEMMMFNDAKQCVLKTICQVSQTKLNDEDLLSKLLRLLFSLSRTKNAISELHYFIAEQNGRNNKKKCSESYPLCHVSMLDMITDASNLY